MPTRTIMARVGFRRSSARHKRKNLRGGERCEMTNNNNKKKKIVLNIKLSRNRVEKF